MLRGITACECWPASWVWVVVVFLLAGCGKGSGTTGGGGVSQAPAERPKLTNLNQVGPKVDLLKLIDPQRDAIRGDYRFDDDGALVFSGPSSTQLNFDVDLPAQYELRMTVARTQGFESLNLGIHVGGATTAVVIEGWGKGISGLNMVDGRYGEDNVTSSTFRVFDDKSPKVIRAIVRNESVLIDVDNNVFIDYRGSPARLTFDDRFYQRPTPRQLMIGAWESGFRVSKWELTPLGEERVRYTDPPNTGSKSVANQKPVPTQPPVSDTETVAANSSNRTETSARSSTTAAPETIPNATRPRVADTDHSVPRPTLAGEEPTSVPWTARLDPSPDWTPGVDEKLDVFIPKCWMAIPDGRSHFVVTVEPDLGATKFTLYDLRTGKPAGPGLTLKYTDRGTSQVSESGEYFLVYQGVGDATRVEVHSFVTGELVYSANSPDARPWRFSRDYLTAGHGVVSFRGNDNELQISRVDLKSGQTTSTWQPSYPLRLVRAYCVSSGGRYLVIDAERRLQVYDLISTKLVGSIPLPESLDEILGFAFSPNARELAAIGVQDERPTEMLWCIDWSNGQTTLEANVEGELKTLSNNYLNGPALEWFPDGKLLLYYGNDVIDRQTGKLCYHLPPTTFWQMPRRAVSGDSYVAMQFTTDLDVQNLKTVKFRRDLDKSVEIIRAGGIATDIGLPPLTVANPASGNSLKLSDNTGPLTVSVEPMSELPAQSIKLPMLLLRRPEHKTKLLRIQFADAQTAVAVAHFHIEPELNGEPWETVVRYDLKRGKSTGSIRMRDDFQLVDVSPDGSRAVLGLANDVQSYSRIDVIELTTKQHVAGWRPYATEPFRRNVANNGQPKALNPKNATWVRCVDSNRILTINPTGKLVCWQLPDCRPLYSCEEFGSPYALDIDRQYLAGCDGKSIHILDVRTGRWAGKLNPDEALQEVLRVAFHPSGKQFVAVLGFRGRREIVFWDIPSGRVSDHFELNYSLVSPGWNEYTHNFSRQIGLAFKRDGYVMMDDLYLIDRRQHTTPWRYNLRRGKHVVGEVDDREWYVEQLVNSDTGRDYDFILQVVELPSDKVLSLIRAATPKPNEFPVGDSVLMLKGEEAKRNNP